MVIKYKTVLEGHMCKVRALVLRRVHYAPQPMSAGSAGAVKPAQLYSHCTGGQDGDEIEHILMLRLGVSGEGKLHYPHWVRGRWKLQ